MQEGAGKTANASMAVTASALQQPTNARAAGADTSFKPDGVGQAAAPSALPQPVTKDYTEDGEGTLRVDSNGVLRSCVWLEV